MVSPAVPLVPPDILSVEKPLKAIKSTGAPNTIVSSPGPACITSILEFALIVSFPFPPKINDCDASFAVDVIVSSPSPPNTIDPKKA